MGWVNVVDNSDRSLLISLLISPFPRGGGWGDCMKDISHVQYENYKKGF